MVVGVTRSLLDLVRGADFLAVALSLGRPG
jgi:hypothetical protein